MKKDIRCEVDCDFNISSGNYLFKILHAFKKRRKKRGKILLPCEVSLQQEIINDGQKLFLRMLEIFKMKC